MDNEDFAVTEEYQAKVLAFMLYNQDFCEAAAGSLKKELFTNRALQWYFDTLQEKQLSPVLLKEELFKAVKAKEIKSEEISKYVEIYDIIKHNPLPVEQEYLRDKLSTSIRRQAVKRCALDTLVWSQEGRWDEIEAAMSDAVRSGLELDDMGVDYFGRVEERVQERAERRESKKTRMGIDQFDAMTYGGIRNKQTALIIGGTGRGKSILLQWLARAAVLQGRRVLYVSMELSAEELEDRFDSIFARVRPQELNLYQKQVLDSVGGMSVQYGNSLVIKHFPMDSATVGSIKAYIKQMARAGIIFDVACYDYLDLIKAHQLYNDQVAEHDVIVKALYGMGQELNLAQYTATQFNRAGLVMETPDESAQAGYIGRQYVMDIVMLMGQTPEEREDEIMRIIFSKNRNGRVGKVKIDTDYSYMTFYREQKELDENGGLQDSENSVEEERTISTSTEEQRDLQLLLEQCTEEQPAGAEQCDGEGDMSTVSTSGEPECGGDS